MNRQEKALKYINIKGTGLEIGPSYNPILRKASGADITIVDHTDQKGLIEKYNWMGSEIVNQIEEVDYVWNGGTLTDLIGKKNSFDFIIASHLIEHTTDLIGFLQDCERLLKPDGILSLIIPDKRFCFDRFKPYTTAGTALDAHLNIKKFHSPGSVLEHLSNSVFMDGDILVWNNFFSDKAIIRYQDIGILNAQVIDAKNQNSYIDIHRWIFTPASFSLIIQDLKDLDYHSLVEIGGFETDMAEFFVSLKKSPKPNVRKDRLTLLLKIEAEMVDVAIKTHKTKDLVVRLQHYKNQIKAKITRIISWK